VRRNWSETVDGHRHEIEFAMHDWTGSYGLSVDGTEVLHGRFSPYDQWRIFRGGGAVLRFGLAGSQADVVVRSSGVTWTADLIVDRERRVGPPVVFIPRISLPPWWGWVCFAIALVAVFVAVYVGFTTPTRRVPVAALGAAGAFLCLRFSSNRQWPEPIRIVLTVVAAAATVALERLSLP
jgi:hypothetical protein